LFSKEFASHDFKNLPFAEFDIGLDLSSQVLNKDRAKNEEDVPYTYIKLDIPMSSISEQKDNEIFEH
jgi:hypothetical protein